MKRFRTIVITSLLAIIASQTLAFQEQAIDPLKQRTMHVAVRENTAFLSVTAGLKIVDLSDITSPREISTVVLPQSSTYCAINGDVVYVAQGPAGVYAVSISDKENPRIIGVCADIHGSAMMVDPWNGFLAVAAGNGGALFWDISGGIDPVRRFDLYNGDLYVRGAKFHDQRLFICAGEMVGCVDMNQIMREESVLGETHISWVECAGDARDIAFLDNHAFVAEGKHGVSVLDISNPGSIRYIRTVLTSDFAHGIACKGSTVYVADGLAGVAVLDASDPTHIRVVRQLDTLDGYGNKITIQGNRLFVANDWQGFLVFDIEDALSPRLIH